MFDNLSDNKKVRIGFVFNHSFFLGGGEVSFFELIRSINRDKFEPIVIVPKKGEIKSQFAEMSVKVIVNPMPPLRNIAFGNTIYALLRLIGIIKRRGFDIIHANGSRACFYSGLAGRFSGVPVIWHVRETLKDYYFYDGILALLARAIICVSKSVQNKRFGRFGCLINNKIFIVYNGIDTNKFKKSEKERQILRNEFQLKEEEVFFGMVGNIIPRKAQDFFLKGWALTKKRKPDLSAKALIIGHPLEPVFNKKLQQIVSDMNLQDDIIFRNYSKKIKETYSALDVFVLCSKSEGFSRSLLEAMCMGLPILATKISEIEEAVREPENTLLVNIDYVEEMALAIITLSENEILRITMGRNNRRKALLRFSLKTHIELIENIYRKLAFSRL